MVAVSKLKFSAFPWRPPQLISGRSLPNRLWKTAHSFTRNWEEPSNDRLLLGQALTHSVLERHVTSRAHSHRTQGSTPTPNSPLCSTESQNSRHKAGSGFL